MLARLDELGLLQAISVDLNWEDWTRSHFEALHNLHPEPFWGLANYGSGMSQSLSGAAEESHKQSAKIPLKRALAYALWLVRLAPDRAGIVLARLKIPRSLSEEIMAASRLWAGLPDLSGLPVSLVTARLDEYPGLAIYAVYLASGDVSQRELLFKYASRWKKVVPSITGEGLIARGLRPGPYFRSILGELRGAWLDGKISSVDEEARLLDELISAVVPNPRKT